MYHYVLPVQWKSPMLCIEMHATRGGAPLREHLPNASDVLMSTSDVLKELLSSVRHNLLHVCLHANMHVHGACSSSPIRVVLDQ